MRKLLRADFARLFKSTSFWMCVAAVALIGVYAYGEQALHEQTGPLDDGFFPSYVFVGFALAAFCGAFLGTEYADGTIRNKLITGGTRAGVYLSGFVTCAAAGLMIHLAYAAVSLTVGLALLGGFRMPVAQLLLWIALGWLVLVAFAAIFTLIAMLTANRTAVVVVCLLGMLALMTVAGRIGARLDEPKFNSGFTITENGVQKSAETPNPLYLDEHKRPAWQQALDILPTGQMLQLARREIPNPGRVALIAGLYILLCNGFGAFLFKEKDLK
ncbi:ABC transporter permease subunit [Bacillota bacterium Meth-B3]